VPSAEPDLDPDPENLVRVSSGPAYTVFSGWTKRWIVAMAFVSGFFSPMTANIYFPALNPIAADLGVSIGLINLTLTTYMIFQGIAPTIFGDFGDMAGRRPAYMVAFTIYIFANLGLALQNSYAALLVLRMLQSGGSSGTLALSYAVVADVAVSAERGKYMGIVSGGINMSIAISPVIGGVLAQYLGWRAIFWFSLIFSVLWLVPYVLSVPETCRHVVGNGSIPPQGWNMTLIDYVRFCRRPPPTTQEKKQTEKFRIPNPFHALKVVFQKDVGLIIFYGTLLYLVFILITATLPSQFAQIYGLNELQIGLCFLPYGFGTFLATIGQGYLLDWNYRRIARKIGFTIDMRRGDDLAKFPIEKARLQPVYGMVIVGIVATIGYGWALQTGARVAVPLVMLFVIGVFMTGSFSILTTLLVDLYPERPATAIAANNLFRCLFGAVSTAVIESMLRAMGQGWCYTFLALISAVFLPMMLVVSRRGPKWREERRLRSAQKAKAKERARS
jgi:MFS family permease